MKSFSAYQIEQLSKKYLCKTKGSCMKSIEDLTNELLENGFKDFKVVEGWIKLEDSFKPQHTWIELNSGKIIDPTLEQFHGFDLGTADYYRIKKRHNPVDYIALAKKYPV